MIFRQELKFQWRSFLVWSVSVLVVIAAFLGVLPSFTEQADQLKKMLALFPEELMQTFNMNIETIFETEGFLGYAFGYVQLLLAIMGALYGFTVVGREKVQRMSDFLLVKPPSRWRVYFSKIALGLLSVLLMAILMLVALEVLGRSMALPEKSRQNIRLISLATSIVHLFFFALAACWATFLKRIKNPVGLACSISFGFYLTLLVLRLLDKKELARFTPFGAMDSMQLLSEGFPVLDTVIMVVLSAALIAVGAWWFHRQDVEV